MMAELRIRAFHIPNHCVRYGFRGLWVTIITAAGDRTPISSEMENLS
jgi:hypothetical protein